MQSIAFYFIVYIFVKVLICIVVFIQIFFCHRFRKQYRLGTDLFRNRALNLNFYRNYL